jgi:hypothetical protein
MALMVSPVKPRVALVVDGLPPPEVLGAFAIYFVSLWLRLWFPRSAEIYADLIFFRKCGASERHFLFFLNNCDKPL